MTAVVGEVVFLWEDLDRWPWVVSDIDASTGEVSLRDIFGAARDQPAVQGWELCSYFSDEPHPGLTYECRCGATPPALDTKTCAGCQAAAVGAVESMTERELVEVEREHEPGLTRESLVDQLLADQVDGRWLLWFLDVLRGVA